MLLGLKVDSTIKPRLGALWNKVVIFPSSSSHHNGVKRASNPNTQGSGQGAAAGTS